MDEDVRGFGPLPPCDRCGTPSCTRLEFSYRGEAFTHRYYCALCADAAWDEAVRQVDERAAKLREKGL